MFDIRKCRYAMMMNTCIASFYIIIGTFDSLVTFIGTVHPSLIIKTKPHKH